MGAGDLVFNSLVSGSAETTSGLAGSFAFDLDMLIFEICVLKGRTSSSHAPSVGKIVKRRLQRLLVFSIIYSAPFA